MIVLLLKIGGLLAFIILPLFKRRHSTKPAIPELSSYAVDEEGLLNKIDEAALDRHPAD